MDADCIIVGAGPAGLAAARELLRRGVTTVVLERGPSVATSWRSRHDHLRLNTHRWFSHQPGLRIPKSTGRYPSRDDYVRYLESYSGRFSIPIRYETEVVAITRTGDAWKVRAADGQQCLATHVVIATGPDLVPHRPRWPGEDTFPGRIIHAAAFDNLASCAGRNVLVVGAGNSGIDLLNHLVRAPKVGQLWLSARSGPNLGPLEILGVPLHPFLVTMRYFPDRVNDVALRAVARLALGNLSRHGLPRPELGGFTRFRREFVAVAGDDGFASALKRGRVTVTGPIESFDGATVRFSDGGTCQPDVVICATGYRTGLEAVIDDLVELGVRGLPPYSGPVASLDHPGLWFFGLNGAVVGGMHVRRREARQLARRIAGHRRASTARDWRRPVPDIYATIAEADEATQQLLAGVLEIRAAEAQQRAMLDSYLADVKLPDGADVLEIGCGTGAVSRVLSNLDGVARVIGVDPSPVFIAKATELGSAPNLSFEQGDGRELRFDDGSFDLVVFHTVLCHLPGPQLALAEANRVLRPGGQVAVFDGDYPTATVALGDADPLQSCVTALLAVLLHDPWLVRKLRTLLTNAGFEAGSLRSHGYLETDNPTYLLTVIDRGIDVAATSGQITSAAAAALKAEARTRVESGTFFGFVGYASIIGRKP